MTQSTNGRKVVIRSHPYEGYPSSFCFAVAADRDKERGSIDNDMVMLTILHRLRKALQNTEFNIECELGDYVLLDADGGKLAGGTPQQLAGYCYWADILDKETYRKIVSKGKK